MAKSLKDQVGPTLPPLATQKLLRLKGAERRSYLNTLITRYEDSIEELDRIKWCTDEKWYAAQRHHFEQLLKGLRGYQETLTARMSKP